MTTDMQVAQTIQQQIGARSFYMMGAKHVLAVPGGLQFQVMKNAKGVTHVRIELASDDTYTVSFHKVARRTFECQEIARLSQVYVDSLKPTIEAHTGLYLTL